MKYYLAPMEGITTHIFRRAYHAYFRPMDKYFTPFLVPHTKKGFNTREQNEILPEHNPGQYLVPQILTNDVEGFLHTEEKLEEYGYKEVNLNLGCPSKTVASKGRGSGFLAFPEELDRFLDGIFAKSEAAISIKTRIGKWDAEEFERLLEIYGKYPIKELIVHPRVQQDFYKNTPNLDAFALACKRSCAPLCYNGDICSVQDLERLSERFPEVDCWMLGRGLIANPNLVAEIESGASMKKEALLAFHNQIYADYLEIGAGTKPVLFKMKEIWCYLIQSFPDCPKLAKKIRKAEDCRDYERAVAEVFALLS